MTIRALLRVALSVCALMLQPLAANSATPAGSVIRNQAQATYFDPVQDRSYSVSSTIATVRVRSAPDFELLVDNELIASPDETVTFSHTLLNTGNETDFYALSYALATGSQSLIALQIFHDVNENGALDPGEPEISQTPSLDAEQSASLLLVGRVPSIAVSGEVFTLHFTALSDADPSNSQTRQDVVSVATDLPLRINKSSFPACATPVSPGSTIDYEIDLLNLNALSGFARDYVIGGVVRRGFVFDDTIPANTYLVSGGLNRRAPDIAELVVRHASSASNTYEPYANYRGRELLRSVGLFIPESGLAVGQSGRFSFQVRVVETITPGTIISNSITVDFDNDGQVDTMSNETCNTVDPQGEAAKLRFLEPSQDIRMALSGGSETGPQHSDDTNYADAPVYRLDSYPNYILTRDGVYLEVRSTALNAKAFVAENEFGQTFIRVRVQSANTADTLFVRLLETAPNSGLFRAEIPFALSEVEAGQGRDCAPGIEEQCILRSSSGDRLLATIFDPGTKVELQDLAVVDPLGLVFDSTTLEPVPMALVHIQTQDGQPAIDPDTGNQLAVQETGIDGRYTIPRLASGLYEIFVITPQDYTFPSIVAPDVFSGRRIVDDRSYGRDGHSGISASGLFNASFADTPPVIDVPIDPDLTLGQLSLEKEAAKDIVSFGDTLTYTLTTRNGSNAVLLDVEIVDAPPQGFRFVEGSAALNGVPLTITRGPDARGLTFPIGRLEIGETAVVTYRLQVGPEARTGERTNVAVAAGRTGGSVPAVSPRATEAVQVRDDGLLSDRAYLIGSVWADADGDGVRDELEVGLPGARVWLEDGTWVETDELGRYSLYGLQPGLRIARLDPETLPQGYNAHRTTSRQLGDGEMRFVGLVAGDLHRADFPLSCSATVDCGIGSAFATLAAERAARQSPNAMLDQALAYEGLIGETVTRSLSRLREQPGPDGDISNGLLSIAGAPGVSRSQANALFAASDETVSAVPAGPTDPETAAATLGRIDVKEGAWLWPLPDAETGEVYARDGRFMVAIRSGMDPVLYVDGEAIGSETLGAVIENRDRGATVAAWYGVPVTAGTHIVEVRGDDMFGNERVLAKTEVVRPGSAKQLLIEPPLEQLSADGRSTAQIVLRVLDSDGAPANGNHFITLEASIPGSETRLRFASQDVQPNQPGHQVRLRDGSAIVGLIAPETPGEVMLVASNSGELSAQSEMRFTTPVRDLIAVGLIELNGTKNWISGALEPADEEFASESWVTDDRAAVFLKGRVKGEALLTFAYDSEKSRDDGLFRDIDPEAYYPIYGDSSEKGFEAQSRSKLYVRLEKDGSSVMWGDFRTDAYAEDSLVRTRRALTGANAFSQHGDWEVQAFAAEASRNQRMERIRGTGLALAITLPNAPLVRNSEVLTIETRSRNNPGLVVDEEVLTRFVDYLLDDETGKLTLKAPLPSVDDNLNPVYLLATYEVEDEVNDALVAGVRVNLERDSGSVWTGLTYDEAQAGTDRRVFASVGTAREFDNARAYVELGISENQVDDVSESMGEAFRAGLEANMFGGALTAEYAQADSDFENPDAPILAGRRESRAEFTRPLSASSSLKVGGYHSEELQSATSRTSAQALAATRLGDWTLSAGPRHTSDTTASAETDFTSAVARIEKVLSAFARPASASLELERSFNNDRSRLQLGGDLLLRDDTRLYTQHRVLDELPDQTFVPGLADNQANFSQQKTIVGIETGILPNTDVYGEWREPGALDQGTGEAAYGVRAQWDFVEGLSVAPHLEIVNSVNSAADEGSETISATDSIALSLAIADRRHKDSRRSARIETRDTEISTFYAARLGWAQRFTPTWTGAVKVDAALDDIESGDDIERLRFTTGIARRPGDASKTDWFALYQWNTEFQDNERRDVHIVSGHANRQFSDRWMASGRAVSKLENAEGASSSAQLIGGRVIRNIAKSVDFEARGSIRAVQWGDAYQSSFGVAGAWQPRDDIRLTLGYNFTGFRDKDLDPDGYDAQGLYWRIAIAIDEDWFGWLRPDRASQIKPASGFKSKAENSVQNPPQRLTENELKVALDVNQPSQIEPELVEPSPKCELGYQSTSLRFKLDSAETNAAHVQKISNLLDNLKLHSECELVAVDVFGHTDTSGRFEYNLSLSKQRADAVAQLLFSQGIDPEIVAVSGLGELNPVNGMNASMNRRVEVELHAR
ncbi:MAG: OmpA family protein [Pseudomonadota bacterium]